MKDLLYLTATVALAFGAGCLWHLGSMLRDVRNELRRIAR